MTDIFLENNLDQGCLTSSLQANAAHQDTGSGNLAVGEW